NRKKLRPQMKARVNLMHDSSASIKQDAANRTKLMVRNFQERKSMMTSKLRPAFKPMQAIFRLRQTFQLHYLFYLVLALAFALTVAPLAKAEKVATGKSHFARLDSARIHYVNYGKGSDALV